MGKITLRSEQYSRECFDVIEKRLETIKQANIQNKKKETEQRKEYKTFAKRFPSLIHTCGLEQAISFAKSKDRYCKNFDDLEKVLKQTKLVVLQNGEELTDYFRTVDLPAYLRLSKEALIVAGWLKKYTEALIEEE